jgi:hypothetical protein
MTAYRESAAIFRQTGDDRREGKDAEQPRNSLIGLSCTAVLKPPTHPAEPSSWLGKNGDRPT